jgi:hypothetical protein
MLIESTRCGRLSVAPAWSQRIKHRFGNTHVKKPSSWAGRVPMRGLTLNKTRSASRINTPPGALQHCMTQRETPYKTYELTACSNTHSHSTKIVMFHIKTVDLWRVERIIFRDILLFTMNRSVTMTPLRGLF